MHYLICIILIVSGAFGQTSQYYGSDANLDSFAISIKAKKAARLDYDKIGWIVGACVPITATLISGGPFSDQEDHDWPNLDWLPPPSGASIIGCCAIIRIKVPERRLKQLAHDFWKDESISIYSEAYIGEARKIYLKNYLQSGLGVLVLFACSPYVALAGF